LLGRKSIGRKKRTQAKFVACAYPSPRRRGQCDVHTLLSLFISFSVRQASVMRHRMSQLPPPPPHTHTHTPHRCIVLVCLTIFRFPRSDGELVGDCGRRAASSLPPIPLLSHDSCRPTNETKIKRGREKGRGLDVDINMWEGIKKKCSKFASMRNTHVPQTRNKQAERK
jgi:hypothetical protein